MKKVISILLILILILALTTGCSKKEAESPITTEVKVVLPCSTGARAIVEGEAVIATQMYLLARAYFEKLGTYDMKSFDAQEYIGLLTETLEAFRIAETLCNSFESHAAVLVEMEENETVQQQNATYELLSASAAGNVRNSPFVTVAYAAEEKSAAIRYAEELTKTFDHAKNGQKLKTIAEKYGTDVKKAKVMLDQAQAILEGAAYEDQAAFENKCYEMAAEMKAACSTIGFGVACMASSGLTLAGSASMAGIVEAGGIVCSGLNAVVDMSTAVTIHSTNGEGNEMTAVFEKASEALAPVSTVFAIGGGIQNIKDFRNPEKALEAVDNAAQAFLIGLGLARDYVQDGTVLGLSSNIVDGYREIIIRSADISNPEAVKEVLLKTGISEDELENIDKSNNDETASPADQTQHGYLGMEADVYIETMGELVTNENPIDMDAFVENVDNALRKYAADEGTEVGGEPESENLTGSSEKQEVSTDINGIYSVIELRFIQADIAAPFEEKLHITLNGTELTVEGETDFVEKAVFTYDPASMTAVYNGDQTKAIMTFDGRGNLLYSVYNTNDGLLYIEMDATK